MAFRKEKYGSPICFEVAFYMKKTKVLLVDDEPSILLALEFLMLQEGHVVLKANNGQEALSVLESEKPNLVILDVMMPGLDGFEVAQRIRKNPNLDKTQIIFLTARGTQEDRFKGYDSGGEVYLTKPFDNKELVDLVNEVLEFG